MEEGWRRAAVGKMVAVAIVAVSLLGALSAAAILQPQKAWADDGNGPYAMIYQNSDSYTYTLVFQNDNVPDSRYGRLAEEPHVLICDQSDEHCDCWCPSYTGKYGDITKVIARDRISPHTTSYWFYGYRKLEVLDLRNLDTSNVRDMSYMFAQCDKLSGIDLRNFRTANVETFEGMFYGCDVLKSLDLLSFTTPKVVDMSRMFEGCDELESLDLSSLDMRNVLNAVNMFPDYGKLATVKVGANTNVRALLPVPDRDYVEGATGKWMSASGAAYDPASIPAYRADTYKAQRGYSVANMDISLSDYWFDYSGRAIEPVVAVTLDYSTKLRPGIDYTVAYKNNVNAGTASVVVTGKGNYGGTATETFNISSLSLSDASISKIPIQDYTGKAKKPVPTVKVAGKTLKKGRDFTLKYYWNKDVGNATVYITGKGNYSGTTTAYFTIAKRTKQAMTVKANAKTAKAKILKKKAVTLSKSVTVKKAKGAVSYKNVSTQKAAKKFKVNAKNGKITLSKGTKKGTYKVKIKVTAAGNKSYKPLSKTVTVKVRVK